MTLVKGACISCSNKHKINTKNACESELVGVDDYISTVMWALYFIQEQGFDMTHACIYQYNKSMYHFLGEQWENVQQ